MRARVALILALGALASAPVPAVAAGPPVVEGMWASAVLSGSARLNVEIDINEQTSTYHFDYITDAAYRANVAAGKDGFTGTLKSPPGSEATIFPNGPPVITRQLFGLVAGTAYRYRVIAKNPGGTAAPSPVNIFVTRGLGGDALLPDLRGWEMVSPVDKQGGDVAGPGAIAGGGVLQAAASGGAVTYSSGASFAGGTGAPPASQYVATRGDGGWATQNITTPIFSGSYDGEDGGAPYQLFAGDLSRALLLNGDHCRGGGSDCAVANPPPAGTGAPPGYQNYYLRETSSGGFEALVSSGDVANFDLDPADFDLLVAGTSPDLRHVVLSTCAALTTDANEVPLGPGCDPAEANLYTWSEGSGLDLVNLPPAQSEGQPGAVLAAQAGAISTGGTRVYWIDLATGNLYLRDGAQTYLVDAAAEFQAAAADGSKALFTKAGHLYRYGTATHASSDLTPAGGVIGVLGASADASRVYFQAADGLKLWHDGVTTTLAPGSTAAAASNYPPATGTSRVSPGGGRLVFVSTEPLTGFDNVDLNSKALDSQVFLYNEAEDSLLCVSCNPTRGRPIGPSSIPGSVANGTAPGSISVYKPRVLSSDGRRVFFESGDAIAPTDTNLGATDVYQWEARGEGSCTEAGGCIALISSGRSAGGAGVGDASADGSDAFFLTDDSLVGRDIGAVDLYDARIGGGTSEPSPPIPCQGDACQFLPPQPTDPTLTTLLSGPGNPKVRFQNRKRCRPGFAKRGKKCVKKKHQKKKHQRSKR